MVGDGGIRVRVDVADGASVGLLVGVAVKVGHVSVLVTVGLGWGGVTVAEGVMVGTTVSSNVGVVVGVSKAAGGRVSLGVKTSSGRS